MHVLDWSRGGMFDFFEGGYCDSECEEHCHNGMRELMAGGTDEDWDDDPELNQLCRNFHHIQKKILGQRYISALCIDAYKLVICTGFEIAIIPVSLCRPGMENAIPEEWQEN